MTALALVALGLLAAAPVASAENLPTFIDRIVAEYGGQRALSKAAIVRATGTVASTMRGGALGTMTRVFSRPGKLRVEVSYGATDSETRALDGAKGWRNGVAVQGPPLDAMVLQAGRLDLPALLLERRATVKDLGVVEREGAKVRALEVPLNATMTVTVEVDPATHRIVRSTGRTSGAMPIEFVTSYADFKKVDGLLWAFTEKNLAMGRATGDTTLEKIEVLAAEPKGAFGPP